MDRTGRDRADDASTVTVEDVRALAGIAGLPLDAARAALLAPALEADLRIVRRLRAVDAGETHPLGVSPPPQEQDNGR